jgi:glycosyltransferase involved in cell wall biosynthesis
VTDSNRKLSDWFPSISTRLEKLALQKFDYPAFTAEKLDRDFQKLFRFFKAISRDAHVQKMVSYEVSKDLRLFEAARQAETISDLLPELESKRDFLTAHQESVSALLRKTARLSVQLQALRLTVDALDKDPILGLATLRKKVLQLEAQLRAFDDSAKMQSAQLTQFIELASWNLRVVVPKSQIAAGFSEIGIKALFEVAYGVDAPRATRRAALAALGKWASSIKRIELSKLFSAHREFTSTKRTLDAVADLNFIAYEHSRRNSGKYQVGEEYFVLLECLRFNAGAQAADNLLWVANFVGKLEATVLAEAADRSVHLAWINLSMKAAGYSPIQINPGEGPTLDRIASEVPQSQASQAIPVVSVILPVFNGEKWISTAIQSLLAQTLTAIEVIVVDDCSSDSTYAIVKSFEALDPRVRVLRADTNRGPYHCRNIALTQAKGTYVTVHDADDWSHPQKIEVQVRHLEANPSTMANVSKGARVDEDRLITGLSGRAHILRPNFSSLMFRREPVTQALGFWDEVRFGGDSEFQYRLIGHFGKDAFAILETGLLSLLRIVDGSLTGGGIQEVLSGARLLYKESFQKWHKQLEETGESPYLDPNAARRFFAPRAALNREPTGNVRNMLIVADFSDTSSEFESVMSIINEGLKNKLSMSIAHVPSIDNPTSGPSREIEDFALANDLDMTWHSVREPGADGTVRVIRVLATEASVAVKYDRLPKVVAVEHLLLVTSEEGIDADLRAKHLGNYHSMLGGLPRLFSFGVETLTLIRDFKWSSVIASETSLTVIDEKSDRISQL